MYGIDNTPINIDTMKIISNAFGVEPTAHTQYIEKIGVYVFFQNILEVI